MRAPLLGAPLRSFYLEWKASQRSRSPSTSRDSRHNLCTYSTTICRALNTAGRNVRSQTLTWRPRHARKEYSDATRRAIRPDANEVHTFATLQNAPNGSYHTRA